MTAFQEIDETARTLQKENEEYHCSVCQELLPRIRFSKKTIRKHVFICHHCQRSATAARVKQPAPRKTKQGQRSDSGIQRRPNNWGYCDYVDRLISMDCFADMVRLKVFSSAKDMSESMAALQAVKQQQQQIRHDFKSTICLCVGDGSTPRTAVLACYLQQWESVVSIDPALKDEWAGAAPRGVMGLTGFQGTLQDYMATFLLLDNTKHYNHLVILLVHSHARFIGPCNIDLVRAKFGTPPTTLVSLPCCTRFRHTQDLQSQPTIQYDDDCVFSACRTVQIWEYREEESDTPDKEDLICRDVRAEHKI